MDNQEQQFQPKEQENPRTKELDKRIQTAGIFLASIDQAVAKLQIDEGTGKISYQPQDRKIDDSSQQWFAQKHQQIIQEYQQRQARTLQDIRKTDGVLDSQIVEGAVVITYDSSKNKPAIHISNVKVIEDDPKERGNRRSAQGDFLGIITIDINSKKRTDGVTPTTSAQHELHHHNLQMVDYILSRDPNVNMVTAVRDINSELFNKGVKSTTEKSYYVALTSDEGAYSALLGREYSDTDRNNLIYQFGYLDELHSSFLQRNPRWFSTKADVYSTVGVGKHWEIVGNNQEDQSASKDMLGYLQATYIMDTAVISTVKKQVDANPEQAPDYIKEMVTDWQDIFGQIGGVIGTSRTVQQAHRLVEQEWQDFRDKHKHFFEKNQAIFEQLVASWEERDIQADNLRRLLVTETNS